MIEFKDLSINQIIYIVDIEPVSILKLEILKVFYIDDIERLTVFNNEIVFDINFDDIQSRIFTDRNKAYSIAVKYILDETNKYISKITDGKFLDYFELDKEVEYYKHIHPEIFI